ncbi:filamentous hemagglutinin family protein [Methyloversatilis sp. XJ19-13]|uniref:filamentous haemagglutinin family protein n=1 Tax=Methyloversatilis sp. XJ19-13 TaxID=2963430 RepID=UPI00211CBE63|nr:filamentous haemagglutinin family protein [Methyloversatilis sp. XJ19-13]MCQ9375568.1 filamentous hemagglutinin family protein [Methyloversatilis sp. XJ19-13]
MNKRLFRLKFDRSRGMLIPAAEGVRAQSRSSGRRMTRVAALLAALGGLPASAYAVGTMPSSVALAQARAMASGSPLNNLPVQGANFNHQGRASVNQPTTKDMVITQQDGKVILNWSSFDIGKGYSVEFVQPENGSALNRIESADPSLILGNLRANGEVLLYNSNGVIFGPNARVDVSSFVATTLNIADSLFNGSFRNVTDGSVSFGGDDANPNGFIRVENGAEIRAAAGGQVLMFAPRVLNEGRIEAPGGQVGVAAGQKIYLRSSLNAAERGLLIEVDPFEHSDVAGINTVENAKSEKYWVDVTYVDADGNAVSAAGLPAGLTEAQRYALRSDKYLSYWVDGQGNVFSDESYAALTPTERQNQIASGQLRARTLRERSETMSNAEVAALTPEQRQQRVAENRLVERINEIVSERGVVTMVGLAVRQMGTVRATTAVKGQNGSIRLFAHGKTRTASPDGVVLRIADQLGDLVIGEASLTEVTPVSNSSQTQLDAETYYASSVKGEGRLVSVESNAVVRATGGSIDIRASTAPTTSPLFSGTVAGSDDGSRIVVASSALLDVSGQQDVLLDMSRNQMSGRLFAINLADSPLQRDGVLYRENIRFDAREGIEVANVTDFYNLVERSAAELSTAGGSITLRSDGAVVVADDARLDVSGGSVRYREGTIATTLVRSGSRIYRIDEAPNDIVYDEILDVARITRVASYVEGKDAGTVSISGRQVVMQGDVVGRTTPGILQRGDFTASGEAVAVFDTHRLRPKAGALVLGMEVSGTGDRYLSDVVLADAQKQMLPEGFWNAPTTSELGSVGNAVYLSHDVLEAGGIGRLTILANGTVSQVARSTLDLGNSGELTVNAGRVEVDGAVRAASGNISLTSAASVGFSDLDRAVVVGDTGSLSTAGRWVNDRVRTGSGPADVAINGGNITLAGMTGVMLGQGSVIDVSAGAWQRSDRSLGFGEAGNLTIRHNIPASDLNNPGTLWALTLNGSLRGYGFTDGGTLNLTVPTLHLGSNPLAAFSLAGDFLTSGGFQNLSFSSLGNIEIGNYAVVQDGDGHATLSEQAMTLEAVLRNRVLNPSAYVRRESGELTADLYSLALLPAAEREAMTLQFLALRSPDVALGSTGASVHLGEKVKIRTEAGGAITLAAGRSVVVEGTLEAPGGAISLNIGGSYKDADDNDIASISASRGGGSGSPDSAGAISDQAIYLTDTARLLAYGVLDSTKASAGRVRGTLYDGGDVTINARRGHVVAEQGSVIDVSGVNGATHLYVNRTDAQMQYGDAGSITVKSPEGIHMDAELKAGTEDVRATRGSLSMALTRGGVDNYTSGTAYSTAERRLVLTADDTVLEYLTDPATGRSVSLVSPGDDFDASFGNGELKVSASRLSASGFDSIRLTADDRMVVEDTLALTAVRSLQLFSSNIEVFGDAAGLFSAQHVAIGDSGVERIDGGLVSVTAPSAVSAAPGQQSRLTLRAAVIDVIGSVGLQEISSVELDASLFGRTDGEIRLQGRLVGDTDSSLDGALLFADSLLLHAGQVYPTTMSRFSITGSSGSALQFSSPAGVRSGTPLSAYASLNLVADTISFTGRDAVSQGGVVRVPFGSLVVQARDSITLGAGALLSASGAGVIVPVGTTVNGSQWVYSPGGSQNENTVSLDEAPVAKELRLDAPLLNVSAEATVSVAGGGDLQAWEFVSGATGTVDTLTRDGVYAIIPGYTFDFAPLDAEISASDSTPALGARIVIPSGVPGLSAGEYTLLPARYALLPNAYLVSSIAIGTRADVGNLLRADGSIEVSAYTRLADSNVREDSYRRYLVEPGATFLTKSGYGLTSGSDFYRARAEALDAAVPRLPVDAGRLSLVSDNAFDWRAAIDLSAARNAQGESAGRAGQLDLSMSKLAVVDANDGAPEGYAAVSAQSLSGAGAESILLGGFRSGPDSGLTLTTSAASVLLLADDAAISAGELMFAALDELLIGDGVSLLATGSGQSTTSSMALTGDGAFVRVSADRGLALTRSNATLGSGGRLTFGSGVRLAGSEMQIDATGRYALIAADQPVLVAESLSIGARRISIGGASPEADALQLQGSLLTSALGVDALSLRSYSTIDFAAGTQLQGTRIGGFSSLVIDAPALRSLGDATSRVTVAAADILLTNTSGLATTASGLGGIDVIASPPLREGRTGGITIGPGALSIAFADALLQSGGDVVFSGPSSLSVSGNLTLSTARVTAATAADATVTATGMLTISDNPDARSLGERTGAGASLSFAAESILQEGHVRADAGQLDFIATGSGNALVFAEDSVTEARGFTTTTVDGYEYYADGGRISVAASTGNIIVDGALDVSAQNAGGDGGSLMLSAASGGVVFGNEARLAGGAGTDGTGGRFSLDTGSLPGESSSLDRLAALTGASEGQGAGTRSGGFDHLISMRVRTGDVVLDSVIKADTVSLSVDGGSFTLGRSSRIDADSETGGVVGVFATGNLIVRSGAEITARSAREGAQGGDITLGSSSGRISLAQGASVDASGDDALDGRITLRAQRDGNSVKVDRIEADWNAGTLAVEAVRTYTGTTVATGNSSGSTVGQTTLANDTATYMTNEVSIIDGLGLSGEARAHLRVGVEIVSSSHLTVSNDWNLWSASRAGGEPGYLTLRAAGNLNINGTISDGFSTAARTGTLQGGESWSYRLVAGADTSAANVMDTVAGSGDLAVAGNKMVRTGTGSIEMAAGRDIVLSTASSTPAVVYVAGSLTTPPKVTDPITGGVVDDAFSSRTNALFSSRGGRLALDAGRDIRSAVSNQLINNWFFRTGSLNESGELAGSFKSSSYLAWWSRFDLYKQGVGSFGGGNVSVSAGRDVSDLSVVAPTSAYMSSARPDATRLTVLNGGDVEVTAGRDIRGGTYFVGRGDGTLDAGHAITQGSVITTQIGALAPVLAVMDGSWSVDARGDVSLAGAFNPTLFSTNASLVNSNISALYSTYSDDASLSVSSSGGDVEWVTPSSSTLTRIATAPTAASGERLSFSSASDIPFFNLAPSSVTIVAHTGDLNIDAAGGSGLLLYPRADGNLALFAAGDLELDSSVRLIDIDPSRIPGVGTPIDASGRKAISDVLIATRLTTANLFTALHASDEAPMRIQAGGDLTLSGGTTTRIWAPKQAVITAGGDIKNLDFVGQHHRGSDITTINAGGAITNTTTVNTAGLISLAGPGLLEIAAGRQIDLGRSAGVQTVGNVYNSTLPDTGASVTLAAGVNASLDLTAFRTTYLEGTDAEAVGNRASLVAYVDGVLGLVPDESLSSQQQYDQALERFGTLSSRSQVTFARQVLNAAFVRSYLDDGSLYTQQWNSYAQRYGLDPAVRNGSGFERFAATVVMAELQAGGQQGSAATTLEEREAGYGRGFRALELAALASPHIFTGGDINIVESKVHTQRGGDISFYAPAGNVNVGLSSSARPASGQTEKSQSERGVVAFNGGNIRSFSDGDFQVNTQKVFVIGQGDLMLWSSNGNIDSGRGSNNTVTVPAAVPTLDSSGNIVFQIPPLATGSGIGILEPQDGNAEGTVYLYAPRGEIIALDASIRGPEINLGAEVVRGADNIVGGSVTGVAAAPVAVAVGGLGAVASQGESRTAAGQAQSDPEKRDPAQRNSILTVDLIGLGESVTSAGCQPDDKDCEAATSAN